MHRAPEFERPEDAADRQDAIGDGSVRPVVTHRGDEVGKAGDHVAQELVDGDRWKDVRCRRAEERAIRVAREEPRLRPVGRVLEVERLFVADLEQPPARSQIGKRPPPDEHHVKSAGPCGLAGREPLDQAGKRLEGQRVDSPLGHGDEVEVAELGIEPAADRAPVEVDADELAAQGGPQVVEERRDDAIEWLG